MIFLKQENLVKKLFFEKEYMQDTKLNGSLYLFYFFITWIFRTFPSEFHAYFSYLLLNPLSLGFQKRSSFHCFASSGYLFILLRRIEALQLQIHDFTQNRSQISYRNGAREDNHPKTSSRPLPWQPHPPMTIFAIELHLSPYLES